MENNNLSNSIQAIIFSTVESSASLTNIQKNIQVQESLRDLLNFGEVKLLAEVERVIHSLPAGKIVVGHKQEIKDGIIQKDEAGKAKTVPVEKDARTVAKTSMMTAFKNIRSEFSSYANTVLKFKKSAPRIDDEAEKKVATLEDKLITAMGDTVSSHHIKMMLRVARALQVKYQKETAQSAELLKQQIATSRLDELCSLWEKSEITKGMAVEVATNHAELVSLEEDMIIERIEQNYKEA